MHASAHSPSDAIEAFELLTEQKKKQEAKNNCKTIWCEFGPRFSVPIGIKIAGKQKRGPPHTYELSQTNITRTPTDSHTKQRDATLSRRQFPISSRQSFRCIYILSYIHNSTNKSYSKNILKYKSKSNAQRLVRSKQYTKSMKLFIYLAHKCVSFECRLYVCACMCIKCAHINAHSRTHIDLINGSN